MNKLKHIAFFVLLLLFCGAVMASAEQIRVLIPADENATAMDIRQKALEQGFVEAVTRAVNSMLPSPLSVERTDLLKEYYTGKAARFVLGYKELGARTSDEGFVLDLDVNIDRRGVRRSVEELGLFRTADAPVKATVNAPADLTEEEIEFLKGLQLLYNIAVPASTIIGGDNATAVDTAPVVNATSDNATAALDAQPFLTLERLTKQGFSATLVDGEKTWRGRGQTMDVAWHAVWRQYFYSKAALVKTSDLVKVSVSGWFNPDGVQEFDGVIRGWVGAVTTAKLLEMDMESSGVSAVWEVKPASMNLLQSRLKAYLPERGLSYTIDSE